MRKQKIDAEKEKQQKIQFLLDMGYTLEEANQMRLKVSSPNSYLYWIYKENMTKDDAMKKVSDLQKTKSRRCKEYWINKGYSEEESLIKVSNYQDNVSFKEGDDIELYKIRCNNRKINKEKYIKLYGEEIGTKKWLEKKDKSKITLENMIRVYGESIGNNKWLEYLEKQKNSQSETELIKKHGVEKSKEIMNHRKNLHKLCMEKFKVTGNFSFLNKGYSKSSQKLFWSLYQTLPENLKNKCYFKELNHEFALVDSEIYYLYDFVISNINLCIEFNGDIWHANPNKYKEYDIIFNKKAKDIWENDRRKIEMLKEKRNINTIIVWESDWLNNRHDIEKKLIDLILNAERNSTITCS